VIYQSLIMIYKR